MVKLRGLLVSVFLIASLLMPAPEAKAGILDAHSTDSILRTARLSFAPEVATSEKQNQRVALESRLPWYP